MSKETLQHLNTNVLIGNTDARGTAWHYRADQQGDEPNHYTGFIPVSDVQRRLFFWEAESRRLAVEVPAEIDTMTHLSDGGHMMRWVVLDDKQAISRSDDTEGRVMGVFAAGYAMHQYNEWLLTQVADILDDTLGISSAGLLKGGVIAWVEVSIPETIVTPEGVSFRPNLLATTSFDGSIATTYKRSITSTVCDNTRELVLAGAGEQVKVKHSRHSHLRLADARAALSMIHTTADDFMAEVKQLCAIEVTQLHWDQFLGVWVPLVDDHGEPLSGRSKTMAEKKRAVLQKLYRHDDRVAPWVSSAHGVLQAVNTMEHHEGIRRGTTRPERNMLRTVTGGFANLDREVMNTLNKVLRSH
jgi:phage/plasmid-like protein (TIGR03299 family)